MGITKAALLAEVKTAPYAAPLAVGNCEAIAKILNAASAFTVPTDHISAQELLECISIPELPSFKPEQLQYIQLVMTAGGLNMDNFKEATLLFPSGSVSEQNFIAKMTRPASRAEELFGRGTVIRPDDIGACL